MERKAFLAATVAGLGGLLTERVLAPRVLRLGAEPLAQARAAVQELRFLDARHGGARVLVPVTWMADRLGRLLRETPSSSSLYHQLVEVTVDAACLAGWVAFDQGEAREALRLYTLAAQAAARAGDADLVILAGDGQARVLAGGLDRPADALHLLGRLPGDRATPTTRAFLEAQRARALARSGKVAASHRAMDRAATAVGSASAGEAPPAMVWFGPGWLELHRGYCFNDLGMGQRAREQLLFALSKQPRGLYRGTGVIHQRLAEAALSMGEPELAAKHADRADRVLRTTKSLRRGAEVAELLGLLARRWPDDPFVRELLEQRRDDTRYVLCRTSEEGVRVHLRRCQYARRGGAQPWPAADHVAPAELAADPIRAGYDLCTRCLPA
jgi:hypothetical protein